MSFLGLFTSFHGRIGRLTYLGAWFSIFIVSIVSMKLFEATLAPNKALLAQALVSLPLIYFHWVLATKRAHDLDKSGWWLFAWSTAAIPGLITMIVGFITMLGKGGSGSFGLTLILLGIVLIFASFYQVAIKLIFFGGEDNINSFGPPPSILRDLFNDDPEPDLQAARAHFSPPVDHLASPADQLAPLQPAAHAAAPRPAGFGRRGLRAT